MQDGWSKSYSHLAEWRAKTRDFINHTFSMSLVAKIWCLCTMYRNTKSFDKWTITKHLCEIGFVQDNEMWMLHSEKYTTVVAEEEDGNSASFDKMDEMLEDMQLEFDLNIEDESMLEVKEFLRLLKASKELLHEHMEVALLVFLS